MNQEEIYFFVGTVNDILENQFISQKNHFENEFQQPSDISNLANFRHFERTRDDDNLMITREDKEEPKLAQSDIYDNQEAPLKKDQTMKENSCNKDVKYLEDCLNFIVYRIE